jgi:hypothetical protein
MMLLCASAGIPWRRPGAVARESGAMAPGSRHLRGVPQGLERGHATLTMQDHLILYYESLIILCLSIVSSAWVLLSIVVRKSSRVTEVGELRRDRDIRKFLDFTVSCPCLIAAKPHAGWPPRE